MEGTDVRLARMETKIDILLDKFEEQKEHNDTFHGMVTAVKVMKAQAAILVACVLSLSSVIAWVVSLFVGGKG